VKANRDLDRRSSIRNQSKIQNRKLEAGLGERESILEGALDLCKERGRQVSQPFDEAPLINGFDLFSHRFGGERETGNSLRDDRMTRREVGRVFGQWNDHHELAVLIDAVIGENDHRPGLLDLHPDSGSRFATTTSPRFTATA
jgi:hypothetical protein